MIDSKTHERDLQRQLKKSGSDDEVQSTERFAKSGYDFINTAGHGFLVIPIDSPDYMLAKKIVKYGYIGELGIYLEEDDEAPEFLRQLKKFNLDDFILPTNLDFDDSEVRKKMNMHGLLPEDILKYGARNEIEFLMEYRGKDIGIPRSKKDKKVCSRCGKKLKKGETGKVCNMCADDIDKGRDKE